MPMISLICSKNRNHALACFVLACLSGCASGSPPRAEVPGETPPPALDEAVATVPTFTASQVADGEAAFSNVCRDCHSVSEFRGSDFQFRFRRRSAWNLYTVVTETMPEDAPGSLSADTYVAIVSYVLQLNGYEAGETPLPATEAALRQLPLDRLPTSPIGL